MLNNEYKEQALRDLEKVNAEYVKVFQNAITHMEGLQKTRQRVVSTIKNVENYVMHLANRPRDFDTRLGEINIKYVQYENKFKELEEKVRVEIPQKTGRAGTVGVLGGAGVATLGPAAAMSVAMTLGTASTGTAIASLSGVAATNAALAWLGGGAVAIGGAGIAGGEALLTLAGPIGWVIAGGSLAGSLMTVNIKNKEIAKKTEESIAAIKKEEERIKEIDELVVCWNKETVELSNAISRQKTRLKTNRKRDYKDFTEDEMNELASLFNSTEVLSKKIGETVEGRK